MANIQSLKTSITEMPYSEALMVIRKCRDSRRIAKIMAKKRGAKKAPKVLNPFDVIKSMSDAQKAQLRKELLGE